jgi:hypothetical protein
MASRLHISFKGSPIMFCGLDISKSKKNWFEDEAIKTEEQVDILCGNCARTKLFKKHKEQIMRIL